MASTPAATGSVNQHTPRNILPLANSSAAQPGQDNAGKPSSSSAQQSATEYPDVMLSDLRRLTPDYPDTSINVLPSIGQLHHHHEPIICYHEPMLSDILYYKRWPACKPRAMRARSAEQPAKNAPRAEYCEYMLQRMPLMTSAPRVRCKAPPPAPPPALRRLLDGAIGPNPFIDPEPWRSLHPPRLQKAIRLYDFTPYWSPPRILVRMAFTGDVVCTLGPEFSMLGIHSCSRVFDAERYVSAVLQRFVHVVSIGNILLPEFDRKISEMLLRENTDTIFVSFVEHF